MIAPNGGSLHPPAAADWVAPCWGHLHPKNKGQQRQEGKIRKGISEFGEVKGKQRKRQENKEWSDRSKATRRSIEKARTYTGAVHTLFFCLVKSICPIGTFYKIDSYDDTHWRRVVVQEMCIHTHVTARSSAWKHVSMPLAQEKGEGDQIHLRPIHTS